MKRKTVLLTGATGVIGSAILKLLKENKYEVLAPTRKEMDLSDNSSMDRYCLSLRKPVDILINNAGINLIANLDRVTDDNIEKTLQVNLKAPLRLARYLAPGMRKRKYGKIVNVSSIWGLVSRQKRVTYTMTKAGLLGMTRSLALELASDHVLVNAVAPGYIDSKMTRDNNSASEIKLIENNIPLGRLGKAHEIARLVLFLISDHNTYITGQTIAIDGGYTCL